MPGDVSLLRQQENEQRDKISSVHKDDEHMVEDVLFVRDGPQLRLDVTASKLPVDGSSLHLPLEQPEQHCEHLTTSISKLGPLLSNFFLFRRWDCQFHKI